MRERVRALASGAADGWRATAAAVRLTWRASPRLVAALLLLTLLAAALPPVQLALTRVVVERAALDLGIAGQTGELAAGLPLVVWIALAAGVVVLGQLFEPVSRTIQSVVGDRVAGYTMEHLIHAANRWRGLARFEDPGFADDLERVRRSASSVSLGGILMFGVGAFTALFTALGLALVLAAVHPLVPLLLLAATAPQMLQWWRYNQTTRNHLYYKTPEARRLGYYREVMVEPDPAKDVRLYGLGGYFRARYDATFDDA